MISIITVTFNASKTIEKTIESVIQQTSKDYEYIIVDGGSTDSTMDIIHRYEGYISQTISEKDKGVYDAMNKGVRIARGDYICFLNSGDYFYNNSVIEKISNVISLNPGYDIFYGNAIIVFPSGNECWQVRGDVQAKISSSKYNYLSKAEISGDIIHQAIFASKRCFEHNLFDLSYKLRAELDWYYGCIEKGFLFFRMELTVCCYIYGGISEDVLSVEKNVCETKKIISQRGFDATLYEKGYLNAYISAQTNKIIYSKWLEVLHEGKSLANYLLKNGYHDIAIYGYGELGNQLLHELNKSSVRVKFLIDRSEKTEYQGIPCFEPELIPQDELINAVVISAVQYKDEIRKMLNFYGYNIVISLDEILEDMLENEK